MNWKPSLNLIAQFGHFGWGGLFVALGLLSHHPVEAVLLLILWVGVKEFVFDIYVEQDDYLDGGIDSLMYGLGATSVFIFKALL